MQTAVCSRVTLTEPARFCLAVSAPTRPTLPTLLPRLARDQSQVRVACSGEACARETDQPNQVFSGEDGCRVHWGQGSDPLGCWSGLSLPWDGGPSLPWGPRGRRGCCPACRSCLLRDDRARGAVWACPVIATSSPDTCEAIKTQMENVLAPQPEA